MENPEGKTICPECNLYRDIFVTGICLDCFKKKQGEEQEENPLDKYTFEEDEYEKLENDFIEKDNREKNSNNMVVHPKPNKTDRERAIDKMIKLEREIGKNRKK